VQIGDQRRSTSAGGAIPAVPPMPVARPHQSACATAAVRATAKWSPSPRQQRGPKPTWRCARFQPGRAPARGFQAQARRDQKLILIWRVAFLVVCCSEAVETTHLRLRYLADPSGIDAVKPAPEWLISSSRRGEKQTDFHMPRRFQHEILLQNDEGDLGGQWQGVSEKFNNKSSGSNADFPSNCFWKVRSWAREGEPERLEPVRIGRWGCYNTRRLERE